MAETAVRALMPPPRHGNIRSTIGSELSRVVDAALAEHKVIWLLDLAWVKEQTSRSRYVGSARSGPGRRKETEQTIRYSIMTDRRNEPAIGERVVRMGWWSRVKKLAVQRRSQSGSAAAYRGGYCLERDLYSQKDRPSGTRPPYVRSDDQANGLAHMLTQALLVLTLLENAGPPWPR